MGSRERKFGSSERLLLILPSSGEGGVYCLAELVYSYAGLLLQTFPEFSHVVRETDQLEWVTVKQLVGSVEGA